MQSKSITVKILYWLEVIVSARILLFTTPVLLNAFGDHVFSLQNPEYLFISILTGLSIYYFCLGFLALTGKKSVRILHIVGFVFIIGASLCLWKRIEQTAGSSFETYHFVPIFISFLFTLMDFILGSSAVGKIKMKWKSILIIDDDETLIRTVRPMLMSDGYSVLTANTGEEGLRVAQSQKPDLILLDVIMPGMKGRDVCLNLKSDASTENIPVVFLTAKDSQDDIDAELQAGGVAHLTKPVQRECLLSTVQKLIDR